MKLKPIQNPPPPDIGPNSNSDTVANLQAALRVLLEGERLRLSDNQRLALDADIRRQVYGGGTAQAVIVFREQYRLGPGESVDEPTARALNRLLEEMGAFDAASPDVHGIQKLLVYLGYLADGYTPGELDEATRGAIRRFQWLHDLDQTGEPDNHILEHLLRARDLGECAVFGQVLDQVGPVPGTLVTVQDRELGSPPWPELGTVSTNDTGLFKILYRSEQVLSGDKLVESRYAIADLVFFVGEQPVPFDDFTVYRMPEDEPIGEDDELLGLRARRVEEVRIILQARARRSIPGSSEYEHLLSDFRAVWPNQWPGELDEEQRREVTFVARELDVARERVAALVHAFKLSRQSFNAVVPPEVLYGLARGEQRLTDLQRLATAGPERLKKGIYQAMDANLIPRIEDQVITSSIEGIGALAPEQALRQSVAGQPAAAEVLHVALPEPTEQAALVRRYAELAHDGATTDALPAFWDRLRQQPQFAEPGKVEKVQFALQLDALTQGHVPLMRALQGERGLDSTRGLLAMGRDELAALVNRPDVGVPATLPDGVGQDRVANYVDTVVGGLQLALPTETVAAAVQQVSAERGADPTFRGALATFFANATSKALREVGAQFDIRSTPVDAFLSHQGEAVLAGIPAEHQKAVIGEVKRAQCLFRVSTDPDNFTRLLQSPYRSAFEIAQNPREVFIAQNAGILGNEQQLMMMHNRAVTVSSSTLHTYIQLNDLLNGVWPAAIAGPADQAAMKEAGTKVLPNWQQLFGAIELCDCDHCRSVYSPAAYLVDLLHFLDKSKTKDGRFTVLDVLLGKPAEKEGGPHLPARRPDLGQLRLTCENTNTALPYVDLVNEVLESVVPALDYGQIAAYDSGDATTAELRATPQYTRQDAYRTPDEPGARPRLDRAVYPLDLPYDQPLEVARVYLRHLGASLAQLKQGLGSASMSNALAAETLGLSPAGFEVLTGLTLEDDPTTLDVSVDALYGLSADLLPRLAKGDQGLFVAALKRRLNSGGAALSLAADPATEAFDDATEAAVIVFQQGHGWDGSGTVGRREWTALAAASPSVASVVLRHVRPFLQRTGLDFAALTDILKMQFVNPQQSTFDIAQQLHLPGPDLIAFAEGGLQNPSQPILDALKAGSVTLEDFRAWATPRLSGEGWAALKRTILLDGPPDQTCDLDAQMLRHWDGNARDLADAEWQALNRLVRLQRVLGWSWEDLDVALVGLQAAAIDDDVIRQLAQLKRAAEQLDLTVQEAVSLWAALNVNAVASPYRKRFLSRAALQIDPAFKPDWKGDVLSGAKIGQHVAALRSGLRLRAADLQVLRTAKPLDLTSDNTGLDLAAVSHLHRHALLARKLGLAVRDLLDLLHLSGIHPFVVPGDDWTLLRFVALVGEVQASGLSVAQLGYLLGIEGAASPLAPAEPALSNLLQTLQQGLRAIATVNQPADDPGGDLTTARLNVVLEDDQMSRRLVQLVRGDDTYATKLDALPDGLTIPPAWTARLRYDRGNKLLIVRGALTASEQDTLNRLSNDAVYQAAITDLVKKPRTVLAELVDALTKKGLVLNDQAVALLAEPSLTASGEMDSQATSKKFAYLLDRLLPFVRDRLSRALVKQTLAEALGLEPKLLAVSLEGSKGRVLLPAVAGAARPAIDDFLALTAADRLDDALLSYRRLHRVALLVTGLELTAPDLTALGAGGIAFLPAPDEAVLTFGDLHTLLVLATLQQSLPACESRLATVLAAGTVEEATQALLAATGWDPELVKGLAAVFPFALEDFKNLQQLARLAHVVGLLQRMGVSASQVRTWATQAIDFDEAEDIKRAVKARYDETAWLEVAKTLNDPLRESQKAALISYLLPRLGLADSNRLYEHLLIDVDMGACMMTSRIKQAISSVQLFIQRCLMNLEPLVAPSAIDAQHWQWMQNYRVWEANRKVFLYPENWIEPELRDDKTPFFKELESALMQDDVNDESAERVLVDYLEKLDEVAKLQICALYVQRDFAPDEKKREVVHLFGRTANSPAIYYYRQLITTANGTRTWIAWQKIPVDIQGDELTAIVWNRRLYLFWLVVTIETIPGQSPKKAYQLAWSEYRNGRWSPKQVSVPQQVLNFGAPSIEARVEGSRLRVVRIERAGKRSEGPFLDRTHVTFAGFEETGGSFDCEECHGQFLANGKEDSKVFRDGFTLWVGSSGLEVQALGYGQDPQVIFGQGGTDADVVEQGWLMGAGDYLVYQDAQRAYLARLDAYRGDGLIAFDTSNLIDPGKILVTDVPRVDHKVQFNPAIRYLDQRATLAVADSHAWASAGATLSLASLQAMLRAPQEIQGGGLARPVGEDVVFREFHKPLLTDYDVWIRGKQSALLTFETLYHPYVCRFMAQLQRYGIPGVLTLANQNPPQVQAFEQRYQPRRRHVGSPQPVETVDFGNGVNPAVFSATAYATYNWELFFHVPLLVATRLSQNQRFEQAQRWFRYIFDPTDDQGQYWKVVPFQKTPKQRIEELVAALNKGDAELQRQVAEWKDHPFQPHLLARMRLGAYQKNVVMKTIDNLLAWGDQLFRRDTIESINQATQLYVMAANLLGPRPQRIPPLTATPPKTFSELRGRLDELSNAMIELETRFPVMAGAAMAEANQAAGLLGVARSLYFCIPQNDKLLGYWDTVADRLFKIRHCMNIEGVVRELPLFEPPIDPALLVQAAAKGIDLSSVLSDLSAPLPFYRFTYVLQKALELCNDLKSLGAALLATLEKRDGEVLAALRAKHERTVLEAIKLVRKQQVDEADAQITALLKSRDVGVGRYLHYLALTGAENAAAPEVGANIPPVVFNPKPTTQGGVSLIDEEINELDASRSAHEWQVRASITEIQASLLNLIPTAVTGTPSAQSQFGGPHMGSALTAFARYQQLLGYKDSYEASHAGKMATYQRRQQEWALQANSAAREIMQIDKQLVAANIRLNIAKREQANHDLQIENAAAVEEFLHRKYTNEELYAWMQGELAALYFRTYQLAYDLAKRAERGYRFERGVTESNFIQFGVWDSLRKGLLAGERLSLQLRQMERAYLEQNRREYELTKHVSLLTHAPLALVQLKETGQCIIDLPETLFDVDYPGHFMRRIKSVSISIPAVAGPYTSVNCTLTLLSNKTRIKSEMRNGRYVEDVENEDPRFVANFSSIQSIATSTGQNDTGMFELNFRDERYLPFEGGGVVSRWRIELPSDFRQFDYDTISDVVQHIHYTAREGGAALRAAALDSLRQLLKGEEGQPQARLFSLRHEFPSEWQRLQSVAAANGDHSQAFSLAKDRFPFVFQGGKITVNQIELFGLPKSREKDAPKPELAVTLTVPNGQEIELEEAAAVGLLVRKSADVNIEVKNLGASKKEADWTFKVAKAELPTSLDRLEDMLVLCHYAVDTPKNP